METIEPTDYAIPTAQSHEIVQTIGDKIVSISGDREDFTRWNLTWMNKGPSTYEPEAMPKRVAIFQPQQWVNDDVVDSGPSYVFEVTRQMPHLSERQLAAIAREDNDLDFLWEHARINGQVSDYNGPFYVRLIEQDSTSAYPIDYPEGFTVEHAHLTPGVIPEAEEEDVDLIEQIHWELEHATDDPETQKRAVINIRAIVTGNHTVGCSCGEADLGAPGHDGGGA